MVHESILSLVIIVLLLAANAFFVAAEFALVKAKGLRIEGMASNGKPSARMTVAILRKIESYLAACQLGITMASLGLGWVGEPAVAAVLEPLLYRFGFSDDLLHTISFLVGFILFSSLYIVACEQVPKTFAIRKPEPVALWVAYPLHACYLITYPLNWILNKTTSVTLGLCSVAEAAHADMFSGKELELSNAAMLKNLFAFDQQAPELIDSTQNN